MIPRPFELHSPTSLQEALSILRETEDSKVLAGGQSLVPLMKLRLVSPASVIDLGRIPGLRYIKRDGDRLLIGAMTVHDEVATSPLVRRACITLSEAAAHVGDQQVRNRGTIGGTACHADPSGDLPAALVAVGAEFKVAGRSSERVVGAQDFFKDVFTTDLSRDELLTEVGVPVLPPRSGGAYLKFQKSKGDLAIVGVAASLTLDGGGTCVDARLGLAGVGPTPIRATKAEDVLKGRKPRDDLLAEAGEAASRMSRPSTDIRGDADYKREMVKVFVKRALRRSLERT